MFVFAACRSAPCSPDGDPEAVAAVRATVQRIIAADNARDLEAAVACYTEDAQWLRPEAQAIIGRKALRESYASMFDA